MFVLLVLLNLILCHAEEVKNIEDVSNDEFGTSLVASMRNDANLDLSADEEYEDLRAELLAYHTALASLASNRRSLISTPCWTLGGICVDHKLCTGFRYLTEVPGCKDKLRVCCFAWNRYKVKDWRDKGLGTLALPWSEQYEFGGLGVIIKGKDKQLLKKKIKKKKKGKKQKLSHTNSNEEHHDEESEEEENHNEVEGSLEFEGKNIDNAEMGKVETKDINVDDVEMGNPKLRNKNKNNEKIDNLQIGDQSNENGKRDNVGRIRLGNKFGKKKALALVLGANK